VNSNCQSSRLRLAVRAGLLLLAVAGVAAGVYVLAVVPPTEDSLYPRCMFHALTGLHCPGCGTTRALHALLNGRIEQALVYNSLAFIIVPVVGWSLVQSLRSWYRQKYPVPSSVYTRLAMRLLVVLVIVFWVMRNLPWYPFTLLAPHEI
jgi:hypothetical protein